MTIERNEAIHFHPKGTLDAVTRWIATHQDGVAEWLKNVRRQYQADRANVPDTQRVTVLLLKDGRSGSPARIGVLDVGGATLEDVTAWSEWQNPEASSRGSTLEEEETQGNGGKAYMFRLFVGPTRILGVRERRRNCKGFDGPQGTVERGNPGWIPSVSEGRDVEISSVEAELQQALRPYEILPEELPPRVLAAIRALQAFTLVEGEMPIDLYKDRIDADELIAKVVRHEQALLALEQVDVFAIHNGRLLNEGKKLLLPPIPPYPGIDSPVVVEIPELLPLEGDQVISTTEAGTREQGRLTLHTSSEDMWAAYKNLRPRWQVVYRTRHTMVGAKPMTDFAASTPGAHFIYCTVELPALEPAYVSHGRRRPKDGPLVEALDRFIAERIRELARKISDQRKEELDERALDEVHKENRLLDDFKNRFLPSHGAGSGGTGGDGAGPPPPPPPPPPEWGTEPEELILTLPDSGRLDIGVGISVALRPLLTATVRDATGHPVRAAVVWFTSDPHVAAIGSDKWLDAKGKGECMIWARVKGTELESVRVPVRVWNIDHVLLTPRTMSVPLGNRQQIIAEVTDDEGRRSTDVLLDWRHDAEDQLIVRVSRNGIVTGNRLGRTAVSAGAGDVWARIPVEVQVIPNPKEQRRGSGFPRLLLTGRDLDPDTGTIREGDPDQPALWQETADYQNNVWWLNLQNPEAAFAFRQRKDNPILWRTYHTEKVIEMVVQVWMSEEFTRKGEQQRPDYWAPHLAAMDRNRVRLGQQMWKRMEQYIATGAKWQPGADGTAS